MRAAVDRIKITPPEFLGGYIGKPMAGYNPTPLCKGKYDDIFAYGVLFEDVVLNNIKKHLLLISMDILQIPLLFSEYIKEKIEDKYKIHRNQILIHATHTHKSMDMTGVFSMGKYFPGVIKGIIRGSYIKENDKYKVWIAKQITKLVENLLNNLKTSKIGFKRKLIKDPIVRNRRIQQRSDQYMTVISLKDAETDKIYSIICNFGIHPTTMGHNDKYLSAEYPGVFVRHLKKLSNNSIQGIFFTGPAGNLGPLFGGLAQKLERPIYYKNKNNILVRRSSYEFTKALGKTIAEHAYNLAKEIEDEEYYDTMHFKAYTYTFWVPMKDYTKHWISPIVKFKNRVVHFVKRYILIPLAIELADWKEPNFPGFALKHKNHSINVYSLLQYIIIEVSNKDKTEKYSIVGVPGELFTELADKIRNYSLTKPENTIIFQASNDWIAYLFPLKEYIVRGGYEPLASFGPLCGAYVVNNFKELIENIKDGIHGGFS
ncbi:MAG: hypothetical protein ACTSRZ_14050 [Promethearchaeota archaeon]